MNIKSIFLILSYNRGIFGSAQEIYQESGILGFFKGLIPRIAGEVLAIVLASSVTYTVNTYIISDKRYKATFKTIAGVSFKFVVVHLKFQINWEISYLKKQSHLNITCNYQKILNVTSLNLIISFLLLAPVIMYTT